MPSRALSSMSAPECADIFRRLSWVNARGEPSAAIAAANLPGASARACRRWLTTGQIPWAEAALLRAVVSSRVPYTLLATMQEKFVTGP